MTTEDQAVVSAPPESWLRRHAIDVRPLRHRAYRRMFIGSAVSFFGYQFTAVAAPTVTGLSPASGAPGGGTSVTITGTNFTGATQVLFGGIAGSPFTVNSATSITATLERPVV